jgi:ATP-dependent RNA helicase DDX46/PRP5
MVASAAAAMLGSGMGSSKAAAAAARAEAIRQKLGLKSASEPKPMLPSEAAEAEAGRQGNNVSLFSEEVEINDFPQEARQRITGKASVAEITAETGAALTVRGLFFPKGKKPDESRGERKLYVVVEADTQEKVGRGIAVIRRIVKEELHTAATSFRPGRNARREQGPGRYNILAITGGGGGN